MTTKTADGLTIRPATIEDLEAVARLVAACDEALTGESSYEDELVSIRSDWESDATDVTRDTWLALLDDQVVGYEFVFEFSDGDIKCDGYVHPDYLDRGIGSRLLQLAEERARQEIPNIPADRPVTLRGSVYSHETRGKQLYEGASFQPIRHFWQMRITLSESPAPVVWPEGFSVRQVIPGQDERTLYDTIEDAFADHWGHTPLSFEEWSQLTFDRSDFDPSLCFLAFAGDQAVGCLIGFPRSEMGWVRGLGVRREWRKHGLGMALLQNAFKIFYDRGQPTIGLGVDAESLTGATRLYERAGMQIAYRFDTYSKSLRES